jgi:hypothetical protein
MKSFGRYAFIVLSAGLVWTGLSGSVLAGQYDALSANGWDQKTIDFLNAVSTGEIRYHLLTPDARGLVDLANGDLRAVKNGNKTPNYTMIFRQKERAFAANDFEIKNFAYYLNSDRIINSQTTPAADKYKIKGYSQTFMKMRFEARWNFPKDAYGR